VRDIGRRNAQEVHEKESSNTKREGVLSLPWGKIDDGGGGILEGKLKAGGKDGWSASACQYQRQPRQKLLHTAHPYLVRTQSR
jgi:hypothetical protein